jgi:hypothetical protein
MWIGEARMDYRSLEALAQHHPAWRLLRADHAPLIVSFLHRTFIAPNIRTLPQPELAIKLEDALFHLRRELGDRAFPRSAQAYLDDWASDGHAWLRKYYPPEGDDPHFDITPATEKAIVWLESLTRRQFVGTQSRLVTVFELLRQLIESTETDASVRIAELEHRRAAIDAEIARIRGGELPIIEEADAKERFLHAAQMAKALLSDFREVEQNFRDLDRGVRERIATWDREKGALLDEIFGERDAIVDSDEGKSFRAFWDFLMSPTRQEELSALLERAFALAPVQTLKPDRRLMRIHFDWLEAGEVTQRTVARLSEQLRRFIDDKAFLENRRIMQILRDIEAGALACRDRLPDGTFMELDEPGPAINLVMERPLFTPPVKPALDGRIEEGGEEIVSADALIDHVYVDKESLKSRIRQALQRRSQISLPELVADAPLEQGLAELVAYLGIAADDPASIIDDRQHQTLEWTDNEGRRRQATLPLVIFGRAAPNPAERAG